MLKLMKIPPLTFPHKSVDFEEHFWLIEQWIMSLSIFLKMDRVIWNDTLLHISWWWWLKCWNVVFEFPLDLQMKFSICFLRSAPVQTLGPKQPGCARFLCFWTSSIFFKVAIFNSWNDSLHFWEFSLYSQWLFVWCCPAAPSEPVCSTRQW